VPLYGFHAGDDPAAKQVVADLMSEMGFRPIDTGELLTARVLELMAFLNIDLNARGGWPSRSGWKLLGPTRSGDQRRAPVTAAAARVPGRPRPCGSRRRACGRCS
jgi:hypothetical protein